MASRSLTALNGSTDDDAIADVLALQRDPDQQCKALVDLALKTGRSWTT